MTEVKKQKKSRSYWAEIWRLLVRNKGAMIGMAIVILLIFLALTVDIIFDYDNQVINQDVGNRLQWPSKDHWFGTDNLGMLNPRTAIGQRSDGTFMLLVVDGRGPTSFGALYEDIIKIFQDNDAVMAANLDGGNSSAMIYDGNYVNTPVSMYGSRNLPTVFLVTGDN